ncbi:hypothetical protein LEMLEM_LOCUS7252, partial [Lemmus lemmus]
GVHACTPISVCACVCVCVCVCTRVRAAAQAARGPRLMQDMEVEAGRVALSGAPPRKLSNPGFSLLWASSPGPSDRSLKLWNFTSLGHKILWNGR